MLFKEKKIHTMDMHDGRSTMPVTKHYLEPMSLVSKHKSGFKYWLNTSNTLLLSPEKRVLSIPSLLPLDVRPREINSI